MPEQKALHYYALSFQFGATMASVYLGYPEAMISIPRLQAAKADAGVPDGAVLIGVGYLGYMTSEQMSSLK